MLAWGAGWLAAALLAGTAAAAPLALAGGTLAGVAAALVLCRGRRRRLIAAGGFPLSALVLGGAAGWPAWAWLTLLLPLLAAYPPRAWRDAPYYPTPAGALARLAAHVGGAPASVLDAGCGGGAALAALQRAWPGASVHGVEWSPLLAWVAARRCRHAAVCRGDMWAADWSPHDVVYLFQRPESMARAWAKACREMAPGCWLVSLEFAVPDVTADAVVEPARRGGKTVWIYRIGPAGAGAGSTAAPNGR